MCNERGFSDGVAGILGKNLVKVMLKQKEMMLNNISLTLNMVARSMLQKMCNV